jgi:hypothetical protein
LSGRALAFYRSQRVQSLNKSSKSGTHNHHVASALTAGAAQKDTNVTDRSRMGRPSSDVKHQVGYSPKRLTRDLDRVRKVYDNLGRGRFAIYGYWHAVYKLRRKWRRLRKNNSVKIKSIANRAVPRGVPASSGDDLLRLILDETMTTNVQSPSADTRLSKLKSKYFSLLDHVYKQRVNTDDLTSFIKKSGGLNFKSSLSRNTKQKKGGTGK